MKSFEFTGKTIEKAVEEGLKVLNKKQEDVDIKILSNGGLFKKAKVKISFEDENDIIAESKIISQEYVVEIDNNSIKKNFKEEKIEVVEDEKNVTVKKQTTNQKDNEEPITKVETIKIEKEQQLEQSKNEIEEFIKGILNCLKIDAQIEIKENENEIVVTIKGDNSSKIIGYRGECLNAIQYLTNIIQRNNKSRAKRIVVDVENYWKKREESLKALAKRIAEKVIKTNKPYKFEPMKPNERRIIHTTLQDNEKVETKSSGEEPRRCLTVYPKK